jgi:hypothetical protein
MRLGFALVAFALAASPALAQSAARKPAAALTQVDPAAHQAAADDLALAMAPDSSVELQVDPLLEEMFDQLYRSEPDFADLEQDYPGLRAAITASVRPVMIRWGLKAMPLYRADLAKLYGGEFTTSELRELATFLRSPEMQMFTNSVQRNLSFKQTTASLIQEKDASQADLRGDLRSASIKAGAELTPQQKAKISAFMSSPLGRKLVALNPQKLALNAKWFNYSSPEMEKEIEVTMVSGMIDHIAKTDPTAAEYMRSALKPDGTLPD